MEVLKKLKIELPYDQKQRAEWWFTRGWEVGEMGGDAGHGVKTCGWKRNKFWRSHVQRCDYH